MKCKTCDGTGRVIVPMTMADARTPDDVLCPEPHVVVKWCQLHGGGPGHWAHEGFPSEYWCDVYVTVYHDPATVLRWCDTHDEYVTEGTVRCWVPCPDPAKAASGEHCRIEAKAWPTETLGEVVA